MIKEEVNYTKIMIIVRFRWNALDCEVIRKYHFNVFTSKRIEILDDEGNVIVPYLKLSF